MYIERYMLRNHAGVCFTGTAAELSKEVFLCESYLSHRILNLLKGGIDADFSSVRVLPGFIRTSLYRSPELPTDEWYPLSEVSAYFGKATNVAWRSLKNSIQIERQRMNVPIQHIGTYRMRPVIEVTDYDGSKRRGTIDELRKIQRGYGAQVVSALHGEPCVAVRFARYTGEMRGKTDIFSKNGKTWYSKYGAGWKYNKNMQTVVRSGMFMRKTANCLFDAKGKVVEIL